MNGSNFIRFTSRLTTWKIESGKPAEVPPPGVGLVTVIVAHPNVVTLLESTVAVSCPLFTNVVGSAVLFNCTVEAELNPEPLTVSVKLLEPACTKAGEIEVSAGIGLF